MTAERETFGERVMHYVPHFIRHDFGRKFIAVILAGIVYLAVIDRLGAGRDIQDVPVEIQLPESLADVSGKSKYVTLKVSGSDRTLRNLSKNDFKVTVPVTDSIYSTDRSSYMLSVLPSDVKGPFGVQVKSVVPSSVALDLDKVIVKSVPLKPAFSMDSQLPPGYVVGKVTFAQPDIGVRGPARMLSKLNDLQTEVIPLDKTTQSFSYTVNIKNPNPAFEISPARVLVNVEIVKDHETRIFSEIPVRMLNAPGNAGRAQVEFITRPEVEVTVIGSKTVIDLMRKDNIKAYIDVSRFEKSGTYNVKVDCWSDRDNVRIKSIYPENLSIKLDIRR